GEQLKMNHMARMKFMAKLLMASSIFLVVTMFKKSQNMYQQKGRLYMIRLQKPGLLLPICRTRQTVQPLEG
ncbi:MAG: hypothetical protein ABIN95_05775, partial [Mucilaginibacter sp.]